VSPLLPMGWADRDYLWPISRSLNPNFKGVIYVEGDVVISGRLRGRVTLAATGQIIVGDDLTYVTDPGLGTCVDLMGIFGGTDVLIADNPLNAAGQALQQANPVVNTWYTFDDTSDEFVHGVVLALDNFTVEDYNTGATQAQACGGPVWGRGCLFLSGGIIQKQRGAVGTIVNPGGTGYVKRYSYDKCAAKEPPPYFPTTGHFIRSQDYPVDPTGFEIGSYFAEIQNP
jgi:hypothetical protein